MRQSCSVGCRLDFGGSADDFTIPNVRSSVYVESSGSALFPKRGLRVQAPSKAGETSSPDSPADVARARIELLSSISQEFRLPLSLMLGPLEELLSVGADRLTPMERQQIATVHRDGARLLRLINALLDLSRLEPPRTLDSNAVVDLAELTQSTANAFRSAFEQ